MQDSNCHCMFHTVGHFCCSYTVCHCHQLPSTFPLMYSNQMGSEDGELNLEISCHSLLRTQYLVLATPLNSQLGTC